MRQQRGVSLMGLIVTCIVVGILAVVAMKIVPYYLEYFTIKKIFASMEQGGDLKGSVPEIRRAYERRNAIEDVKSVRAPDLEITKAGGETVVSAAWSVKVPLVYNVSACIDFQTSTAKDQQ